MAVTRTLQELAAELGGDVVGDSGTVIRGVAGIREAVPGDITFIANERYDAYLTETRASAVICSRAPREAVKPLLQVDNATVESGTGAKMIETLPNITQNPLAYSMLQAGVVGRPATSDTSTLNSFGIGVNVPSSGRISRPCRGRSSSRMISGLNRETT